MDVSSLRQEAARQGAGKLKRTIISQDCAWNATTLPYPVNPDGLTAFCWQLQAAGAQVCIFDVAGKGVLVVSWRRPDAQIS